MIKFIKKLLIFFIYFFLHFLSYCNIILLTLKAINCCYFCRDALAKEIYSHMFGWLISRVNDIVYSGKKQTSIAVLDIFGFEVRSSLSFVKPLMQNDYDVFGLSTETC